MPITVSGTSITFNDSTTQTTAFTGGGVTSLNGQTGAITNTDLYAIGSYVTGRRQDKTTSDAPNTTLAGSSLYSGTPGGSRKVDCGVDIWGLFNTGNLTTFVQVNTGTWRCMSRADAVNSIGVCGLWVRIS